MSAIVTDTHALLWYLNDHPKLSPAARLAMETAEAAGAPIYVPSIVVVELRYLAEKGTISEADYGLVISTLKDPVTAPTLAPLDLDTADTLSLIPRALVPDMPDRIIAATALHLGLPLVTRDTRIKASSVTVVW